MCTFNFARTMKSCLPPLIGPSNPRVLNLRMSSRRGIGFKRGRLAWVRWLIGQMAVHGPGAPPPGGSR